MTNDILEKIKAFGMTNQIITEEIQSISEKYSHDFGHFSKAKDNVEGVYYPQFSAAIRAEAHAMSGHYETFYCLEKTIRDLLAETLKTAESEDWWNSARIPGNIKTDVASRMQRERDAGVTPRSESELDYTTFGELSNIIAANKDVFGAIFDSPKAVEKVLSNLNTLRGPIAHCSPLAEDEILRLQLAVRDWFRLME